MCHASERTSSAYPSSTIRRRSASRLSSGCDIEDHAFFDLDRLASAQSAAFVSLGAPISHGVDDVLALRKRRIQQDNVFKGDVFLSDGYQTTVDHDLNVFMSDVPFVHAFLQ